MKNLFIFLIACVVVFSLNSCKKDKCKKVECQNGGTCLEGVCDCPTGFIGENCETDLCATISCQNGGTCVSGTCDCPPGFTGTNCEIVDDPCENISCFNGGTCINGACDCPTGFTGTNCETAIQIPVANFSFSGGNCLAPCSVNFNDLSSNATSYSWDFGDGNSSGAQNPSHTYLQGGIYNVSLEATNAGGSDIIVKVVTIVAPTKCIIERVTLTEMPFVNSSGVSWDSSNGPDVYFEINNVSFYSFYTSITFNNIVPSDIPIEWTIGNFEFPDFTTTYYLDIWDNDESDGGSREGIITNASFNLQDLIVGNNPYPTIVSITNSTENATAILELTWE